MTGRSPLLGLLVVVLVVTAAQQWWVSRQQQQLGWQVARAAAQGDIQMISSTTCGICTRARLWFKQHEVRFEECFVEQDRACAARFEALRAPGTPVMVVRGKPQLGFDPQRLLQSLQPAS